MIKVCGNDYNCQLIVEPNGKSVFKTPVISPPLDIKSDSFLSFSFNQYFTAIITKEGELLVIGGNKDYNIHSSFGCRVEELTKLPLKDNDGNQLFPISAVCGYACILFIVSTTPNGSDSDRRLAFFSRETKTENPVFVSTGSHIPVSLYGASFSAAAIDAEGGIIFVTKSVLEGKSNEAPRAVLPDDEEAVSVACSD